LPSTSSIPSSYWATVSRRYSRLAQVTPAYTSVNMITRLIRKVSI
jgi:hypothetical protein